MKKTPGSVLIMVTLVFALLMSTCAMAFANEVTTPVGEEFTADMVDTASLSFVRNSSTKATATVQGISSGDTPYIKSKITLQQAAIGSSSYTDTSQTSSKTEYDIVIYHTCTFTITSTMNYRIKVEFTDKVNGMEITTSFFKTLT